MDNLVLIRVAAVLGRTLDRAALRDFHQESPSRFRLVFRADEKILALAISVAPGRSWIGRPAGPRPTRAAPAAFAAVCAKRLHGAIVVGVEKPPADRRVTFSFADGQRLVAELADPSANLALLDAEGRVVVSARRPRPGSRFVPGEPYRAPDMPAGRIDPFTSPPADVDALVAGADARGVAMSLSRGLVGVARDVAELVSREALLAGAGTGSVLEARLTALLRGELDPVVEAEGPPLELAAEGRLDPVHCRLLPWCPDWPADRSFLRFRGADPAETAGIYHEALDAAHALSHRGESLLAVLDREIRRNRDAMAKVALDMAGFERPERYKHWAEALLAGLSAAQRVGDRVLVSDPYDEEGRRLSIEVPAGRSLTGAAEDYFERHRRALRGLERAGRRADRLADRGLSLEKLRQDPSLVRDEATVAELEQAMQREGIPVGLEQLRSREPKRARPTGARLEGVRLFVTSDGASALIGKSGPDNQRLTFRLAGPEDFWFHAGGVPGAHVIVRNDERKPRPSRATLEEAARAAAWFSAAREQGAVDVQWTRRKYVRKARGAPPGTVTIKRFETVRVVPAPPPDLAEAP